MMLKPFRIVYYPLFVVVVLLFFIVLFNLSSNKPGLSSNDNQSGVFGDFTGAASKNFDRSDEFNFSSSRGTVFFSSRGLRNPFRIENNIREKIKVSGFKEKSLFPGFRFVHLDLKGAPPKISYLIKIFPILAGLGANGLLIEYEDMFPYGSDECYVADNAYTKRDIADLLRAAKQNKLEVIPLLQAFGHAEFVLKLKEYKHLREDPRYPQAYCPSKNETLKLVETLIDRLMAAHPTAKYFHIGCDEVFQLGECSQCRQAMHINNWTKKQLFFNHVHTVAKYIVTHYPNVQVLMWDDELRSLSIAELDESGLGSLVQPIVWKYTADVSASLPSSFWTKYSTVFKHVWIASAFKGATASDATALDLDIYTSNHESWMEAVISNSKYVNFSGAILTGWQRYDHFSVLCELLPVAFPSLAVNLVYLSGNDPSIDRVTGKVREILNCDGPLTFKAANGLTNHCGFPGAGVYEAVSLLPSIVENIRQMKETSAFRGWLTKFNIDRHFSSPSLVEQATAELDRISNELTSLELKLTETMDEVYDSFTVDEWLSTYLRPHQDEIRAIRKARTSLLYKDEWPRRPIAVRKSTQSRNF